MLQQPQPDDYVIGTGVSSSVQQFVDLTFGVLGLTYELVDLHELSNEKADQEVELLRKEKSKIFVVQHPKFYRPLDVRMVRADPRKAHLKLGWHHNVDLHELIKEMIYECKRSRSSSGFQPDPKSLNPESVLAHKQYGDRVGEELKRFEKEIDMHALPAIYHYWSNKFILPMLQEIDCQSVGDFFSRNFGPSAFEITQRK